MTSDGGYEDEELTEEEIREALQLGLLRAESEGESEGEQSGDSDSLSQEDCDGALTEEDIEAAIALGILTRQPEEQKRRLLPNRPTSLQERLFAVSAKPLIIEDVATASHEALKEVASMASALESACIKVSVTQRSLGGADKAAARNLSRDLSKLLEMLGPLLESVGGEAPGKASNSRSKPVPRASVQELSTVELDVLHSKANLVAGLFEKQAGEEQALAQTRLAKTCKQCGVTYSGFGCICSACRKGHKEKQCSRCGAFFAGHGPECKDCAFPQDRALALLAVATSLRSVAVGLTKVK